MRQAEESQADPEIATTSRTKVLFSRLVEACKRKSLTSLREILETSPRLLSYHDKHHRNLLHYVAILVSHDELNCVRNGVKSQTQQSVERSDESASKVEPDEQVAQCLACFAYLLDKSRHLERLDKLWNQADLDGLTILHLAVISCNVPLVRQILLSEAVERTDTRSLAARLDKEHHSPLHWAVITNSLASVRLLVEHSGVQLAHQPDLNGATPLHYATQTCDYPKYRQQLRQMLKNAANVDTSCHEPSGDEHGSPDVTNEAVGWSRRQASIASLGEPVATSGEQECKLDVLVYLTRLPGINLECLDRDARTPLLWAASSGNRQALGILVQAGADALCRDSNRLGAIHCAASHGFIECLELLLQLSAEQQLDQADHLNCTPLFYAVLGGNIECVELLLERGAAPDWQDVKGRTATHFAALKGQLNTLKLLEARQANLWLPNKQGDLPLHYAIKSGRQQVVAWLLERSPYERAVNAINNAGRAPIHLAIARQNSHMVDFLIRRGANLNQLVKVRDKPAPAHKRERANVLVNGSETRANYRYESALDMARRLAAGRCLELLEAAGAQSAAQVLASRRRTADGENPRSLFDMRAAEVASPIGFESSGSSAEPQSEQLTLSQPAAAPITPQLPARPAPLATCRLPDQSDSTGSSALSQSSLTSLRNQPHSADNKTAKWPVETEQKRQRLAEKQSMEMARTGPMRGGIDYQNDFMSASIKCKLHNKHSFPPLAETDAELGGPHKHQQHQHGHKYQPASSLHHREGSSSRPPARHEIITRVNVFTSPIQHHCETGAECKRRQEQLAAASQRAGECASDTPISNTDSDAASEMDFAESDDETHFLPQLGLEQHHSKMQPRESSRFMPPSLGCTQHLPVILSAEEERSTSGETVTGADRARPDEKQPLESGSYDEPRLDRAQRGGANTRRLAGRYRELATSPVADYIHQQRSPIERRPMRTVQQQQQAQRVDYSQVKAKVDSHRNDSGLSSHFGDDYDGHSAAGRRSKSWSSSSLSGQQTVLVASRPPHPAHTSVSPARGHKSRSPAHRPAGDEPSFEHRPTRTIIKTRRLSVDTSELASRVEKSIRKYRQETKLFEELQNLKRSQIRSGRANEALLVKRLIEQFKVEARHDAALVGIETYDGPYTYKAYELYLYDQLRRLSQSNDAKLVGAHLAHKFTATAMPSRAEDERDFLEEDLRAELELQRVINRTEHDAVQSYLGGQADRIAIETSGALEEIRVAGQPAQEAGRIAKRESMERNLGQDGEHEDQMSASAPLAASESREQLSLESKEAQKMPVERELGAASQPISSASSSRRSSVDIERERLEHLPLQVSSVGAAAGDQADVDQQELELQLDSLVNDRERRLITAEANELTAAIITDALGNVSRVGSRAGSPKGARKRVSEPHDQVGKRANDSETAQEDATPQPSSGEGGRDLEGGEAKDEDGTEVEREKEAGPTRTIVRRRSVVNIGNKMEVIDHYVGIAIEPVTEGNRSSDDEPEPETEARVRNDPRPAALDDESPEVGDEQAVEESNQPEDSEKRHIEDDQSKSTAASDPLGLVESSPQLATVAAEERVSEVGDIPPSSGDDEPAAVSSIPRESIIRSEPLRWDRGGPTGSLESPAEPSSGARRASSPPAPESRSATGAIGASSSGRHASISEKVFTGFDLDSMHSERRSKRDRLSRGESLMQQPQHREDLIEAAASEGSRPRKALSRRKAPLRRSRLPRTRYVVNIPIGLVKERWCNIKRRGRRRLRQQVAAGRQDTAIESLGQPRRRDSREHPNSSAPAPTSDCSNFTLIYELSKRSAARTAGQAFELESGRQASEQGWCQAKVRRIVDVRTLKRTLSLPESLLYSNDLLKRFNILKL